MHDGLRVHGGDDVLGRDVEQQVGLNEFQPLVDQGRRVDRDDGPHLPRRMRQGLLGAHATQLIARAATEGATRRGQHEICDLGAARHQRRGETAFMHTRSQRLGDCRMLGIHRDDLPRETHGVLHERTTDDQRLLVRQRQARTALQSGKRRRQAHTARNAVEHHRRCSRVQLRRTLNGRAHNLDGRVLADENLRARATHRLHSSRQFLANVASHAHVRGIQRDDLHGKLGDRRTAGAEAKDVETPAVRLDDLTCLGTDRSRRAKQDDGDSGRVFFHRHGHQSTASRISTARPR